MKYINTLLVFKACENIAVLRTSYFIKKLLQMAFIIIPIGLIVMLALDLAKSITSSSEEDMPTNLKRAGKRLLFSIFVFLVPTITNVLLNNVVGVNVDYQKCLNVTQKGIKNQIAINKKKCQANRGNYEWDDKSSDCVLKTMPPEYKIQYDGGRKIISVSSKGSGSAKGQFKYYNQCSPTTWKNNCTSKTMCESGCGLTSLAIVANAFSGRTVTPNTIRDYVCANGHSGGALGYDWFTNKGLLNKFNLQSKEIIGHNESANYSKAKAKAIKKAVDEGDGVVLLIPGHYVVVGPGKSCSSNEVYLYEVGKRALNGCYTMKKLWNTTYNRKNKCSDSGICGWRQAWAFNSK